MRKKTWRTPSSVFGDEDDIIDTDQMNLYKNWEMFLQMLDADDADDVAAKYRDAEIVVFTRRWRPSAFTLEPFVDMPLRYLSRVELGEHLCKISGLAADSIEIAKAPGTFPCEGSLLAIHDDITWVPLLSDDEGTDHGSFKPPCDVGLDGAVIFWREKGEPLKKLTDAERRDILAKENSDSTTSYSSVATSPRKERPLRIFIDSPESKVKESIEPELD